MRQLSLMHESAEIHPMDVIEQVVMEYDWLFDRNCEEEISVQVPGHWCDFSLHFVWNESAGAMHLSCAFDMRVQPNRLGQVHELLAIINEKLWLGHFSLWTDEGLPMFRHALPLRGVGGPSIEQIEDLVATAIDECERFYPAFQYVIWGGRSPAEAIAAAMVETVGEA